MDTDSENSERGVNVEIDLENPNKAQIENLSESKIGFYNAGGSCYMASIIQILIHSQIFLNKFFKKKYNNKNYFSWNFFEFLNKVEKAHEPITIEPLADEYNRINPKFNGSQGNNPMKFFSEFIKELAKENNEVLDIFKGRKKIKFEGMSELNYEEDFLFLMITLDKKNFNIKSSLNNVKEFEDDKTMKLSEKIIVKPQILILNISHEDINYQFEEYIKIDEANYELKAINRYSTVHSTV